MNRVDMLRIVLDMAETGTAHPTEDEAFALGILRDELDDLIEPDPGAIKAAQTWPTNGILIRDVARLWLRPTDVVVDYTWGYGKFWTEIQPERFTAHDLNTDKGDGHDFRNPPERPGSIDVAVMDPAYVCASLDTEILTLRGWMRYDEVKTTDRVLTFNLATGMAEWGELRAVNVYDAGPRLVSFEGQSHSSLTTPQHRWPVQCRVRSGENRHPGPWQWATSESYRSDDSVPIAAQVSDLPTEPKYTDAFVEIVAWFWTEGHIERGRDGLPGRYGHICQSMHNGENCDLIRAALMNEFGLPCDRFPRIGRQTDGIPRWRETSDGRRFVWWLSGDLCDLMQECAPGRVPSYEFLLSLTRSQLDLFIDRSMRADGHINADGARTLGQKDPAAAEAFQFAAILAGLGTSISTSNKTPYGYNMTTVRLRTGRRFRLSRQHRTDIMCPPETKVWCPTTDNGTWLARRNGTVYFTGNSIGGRETSTIPGMVDAYGMATTEKDPMSQWRVIVDGIEAMHVVLRPGGLLWLKCMNYITNGSYYNFIGMAFDEFARIGFALVDWFTHVGGTGPQPLTDKCRKCDGGQVWNPMVDGNVEPCPTCNGAGVVPREQQHARNNASVLLVARKIAPPVDQPAML